MRLDKMLSECGLASRTETAKAVRAGVITVNGAVVSRADVQVDPERDAVMLRGAPVRYRKFVYVMLNKPDGYVSATEDGREPVVTELLPEEYRKMGIFPCGRLDKHTLGLMLLTNDGPLSHRLLSPKRHVGKTYAFSVKFPLSASDKEALEAGVDIGGYVTAPCHVERLALEGEDPARMGHITLHEGKYHQIKLMMEARHNQITCLHRATFGPLTLDASLAPGEWRLLSDDEIRALDEAQNR